ncbi:MAG: cytochrome P450 [Woeseia sp.]|nr:cytochrome P450 [Woeseia sp.]
MPGKAVFIETSKESANPFEFLRDVTRSQGDAVQYSSPFGKIYLLNHPDYIRQVFQSPQFHRTSMVTIVLGEGLLASDGAGWKTQRKRVAPFFNRASIAKIEPAIRTSTRTMLERWESIADSGDELDVAAEMTELTLTIIVDALFGVDLSRQLHPLGEALDVLLNDLGAMGCTQFNTPLVFSSADRSRFHQALTTLNRIVADIIDKGRRGNSDPDNLLSFLLETEDEDTGLPLTDVQLRDEIVTLMIAGHETTSLIISWAFSLLAANPICEGRLHHELDQILGERLPDIDDLNNLPYTLMTLQESMRLYPPVWFIARKTLYAGRVGNLQLPENVLVMVSPYAMHRHRDYWQNPEDFDPSRFAVGNHMPKYSYIPFGGGHHLCLGMNLALVEGQLILASIAKRFSVRPSAGRVIEPAPAITLRQRDGLFATLERRRPGSAAA